MAKIKVAALIFFLVIAMAEAADASRLKPIWWFPVTDGGINFTGMQQFFMDPHCDSKVIEAIHKDLFTLKENGFNTVVVRIPNASMPWQRFHGSFDSIPAHDQLKAFIAYIDVIWLAKFNVILAFDWNVDPYRIKPTNSAYATEDSVVSSSTYTINPFNLEVVGNHSSSDYIIRVKNAELVRKNQVFKNKRTKELIALGNSLPVFSNGRHFISVATVKELGWRTNRRTGGRGFGEVRAANIKNGDILELQGSSDWIEKYLAMVMRAGDFYPDLKNLVDHEAVAGWILLGESIFWANSEDVSYRYISHDDFYLKFWNNFHDLVKSGNGNQLAMAYSLVLDTYDNWSLGLLKNMKKFFLSNFPHKPPDLWGLELYQKIPEKAYIFSRRAIDFMINAPPFKINPDKIFVGEWAFDPSNLAGTLKRNPEEREYDKAQTIAFLSVKIAVLESNLAFDMHWGWWAIKVPQERTRGEDIMGLAYPLEAFLCGKEELTGSDVYELRPAQSLWRRIWQIDW